MTQRTNKLIGIQLNCHSLTNKLSEIKLMLYTKKPEFMALSETWIANHVPKFVGYSTEWKHRAGIGGGLGFVIKRGLQYKNINLIPFNNGYLEYQTIQIYINKNTNIVIMNLYNPSKNITIEEISHYTNQIKQLGNKFMVIGDFNAHTPLLKTNCTRSNVTGKTLERFILSDDICLITPVNFYTYLNAANGQRSCLDLCLTSANIAANTEVQQLSDVGSDHIPVKITLTCEPFLAEIASRQRWKVNSENLSRLTKTIKSNELIRPSNINDTVNNFTERLYSAASDCIGRTTGILRPHKRTAWWDESCSRAVAERRTARRNLERHPTPHNAQVYQQLSSQVRNLCKTKKSESFKKFVSDIHFDTPPAVVWKKIKSLKGYEITDSGVIEHEGNIITDPKEKSDLFAKTFQSVARLGTHSVINNFASALTDACNNESDESYNQDITHEELKKALNQTKNTCPGPDDIPYSFLKSLSKELLDELLGIMNQSFKTGEVPEAWKMGLVVPVYKPGKDKKAVTSYRPITMLSCIGKTLERVIQRRLEYVVESRGLLSASQCGFRRGQGTLDVLLRLEHTIRKALAAKEICIVTYIDLKSAFDTVWGEGLIYKLIQNGLKGPLIKWLNNYFLERTIKVQVAGSVSEPVKLIAGTPQGAVLSPILFNLMLQDIPQEDGIIQHIYADDITISCCGADPCEVRTRLQNYLKKFVQWADFWGMIINPEKTYIQHYTRKRIPCPNVKIRNQLIEYKKVQRLLGLYFDSPQLTWKHHIDELKSDCMRRLDLLKALSSTVWGASTKILRNFYIAYIRAKIDYGSIVYASAAKTNTDKLEVIQNSCMRLILGARRSTPILSLQAEAYLPSLTLRRGYLSVKEYIKLRHKPDKYPTTTMLNMQPNNVEPLDFPSHSFARRSSEWLGHMDIPTIKRIPTGIIPALPPWKDVGRYICLDFDGDVYDNLTFQDYITENFPNYTLLYTDGSKLLKEHSCYAASAMYSPTDKTTVCWKLRSEHSVLSTELYALWQALTYVRANKNLNDIAVFTDSRSALQIIGSVPKTYTNIVGKVQLLLLELNKDRTVLLHWVRGHIGVTGNEVADRAANLGHDNNRTELYELTREEYNCTLKYKFKIYWNEYWKSATDHTAKGLFLRNIRDNVFDTLPVGRFRCRRHEVVIHRLRMGHAGVNQYLHRFNMEDSEMCEYHACQASETIEHFLLTCPGQRQTRTIMFNSLRNLGVTSITLKILLGGDERYKDQRREILRITIEFIKSTNRMDIL